MIDPRIFRAALGPIRPCVQWVPWAITGSVKRPEPEAGHSPCISAEVRNSSLSQPSRCEKCRHSYFSSSSVLLCFFLYLFPSPVLSLSFLTYYILPFISLTISHVFPLFVLFSCPLLRFSVLLFLFYLAVIVAGVLDRVTIGYLFNALILPCKRHAVRPSLQTILNCQVNSLHTYPVGLSTSRAH